MRGRKKGNSNAMGKTVAKENLPSKVCVLCNRPFTWRKKWERVWDEVTTCSKSCNAKRRSAKKSNDSDDGINSADKIMPTTRGEQAIISLSLNDSDHSISSSSSKKNNPKAQARKEHKKAIKQMKAERRLKRSGQADPALTRKPCDLCTKNVDLLIRCTVDETLQYKMVCGGCWKGVSGGVVDGDDRHPYYRYGGLWKNRYANLKKRVGNGASKNTDLAVERDEMILGLFE